MLNYPVKHLRTNGGTQARASIDSETVEEYASEMHAGAVFPPVVAFRDRNRVLWLADGFHRVAAYKRVGIKHCDVEVREGTRRAAILYAAGANAKHGVRRTNADKRRAVEMILSEKAWSGKSDRWIAEKCGVGNKFVGDVRRELCSGHSSTATSREGRDGKLRALPQRRPSEAAPSPVVSAAAQSGVAPLSEAAAEPSLLPVDSLPEDVAAGVVEWTPAQRALLEAAIEHSFGSIRWHESEQKHNEERVEQLRRRVDDELAQGDAEPEVYMDFGSCSAYATHLGFVVMELRGIAERLRADLGLAPEPRAGQPDLSWPPDRHVDELRAIIAAKGGAR